MPKSDYWTGEVGSSDMPTMDHLNIFTLSGFRFIFPAQAEATQAFESALAFELDPS